jgi:hypothetical protein
VGEARLNQRTVEQLVPLFFGFGGANFQFDFAMLNFEALGLLALGRFWVEFGLLCRIESAI